MQTEGAGHRQGSQQHTKEVAAGLHRPAAAHPAGHLQGEQAAVQGDAAHHLAAAGPRTHHGQQLLHERPPPEPGQMDRRRSQPRSSVLGVQHLYQSMIENGEGWGGFTGGKRKYGDVLGWGGGGGWAWSMRVRAVEPNLLHDFPFSFLEGTNRERGCSLP